jgi:hypothetical protein
MNFGPILEEKIFILLESYLEILFTIFYIGFMQVLYRIYTGNFPICVPPRQLVASHVRGHGITSKTANQITRPGMRPVTQIELSVTEITLALAPNLSILIPATLPAFHPCRRPVSRQPLPRHAQPRSRHEGASFLGQQSIRTRQMLEIYPPVQKHLAYLYHTIEN